jgi:hypothetical protein
MDSVVEVGALHGRSSFALLTGCPGTVYCIDPWNDPHGKCLPSFVSSCGHFENLMMVQGYSPEVAGQIPEVDMVWIDGDHSFEATKADIETWLPKTRKLICGHDWNHEGFPGVREAVSDVLGKRAKGVKLGQWSAKDSSIWVVDLEAESAAKERAAAKRRAAKKSA